MIISKRRMHDLVTYALLAWAAVVTLLPFVGILLASLHSRGTRVRAYSIPEQVTLETFAHAWREAGFATFMRTSFLVTAAVVTAAVILSILAGYGFSYHEFRGSTVLFALLFLGLTVPNEATVVPLYFEFRSVGLIDTYWALILPQIGQFLPFGVLWMRAAFRSTPPFLAEAAKVDRASSWSILWRILVPVTRPAILTLTLLISMWSWNMFLLPLVMVTRPELRTAPLALSRVFRGEFEIDIAGVAAGSIIISLPIVLLFLFLQRHFIKGMLSGGVAE